MSEILFINGKVRFPITIDPTVWIFDDRKVDLTTYFDETRENTSEHWDREIRDGAAFPPIQQSVKKYKKEQLITGTFGIPFHPFLANAEISDDATQVEIETVDDTITLPLDTVKNAILGFSKEGKPLKEDGPVHLYYNDGSNRRNPIRNIRKFTII
ncbi:peptidyl-prolyl cis-trans isomerase [Bacillus anthracis]|uniref:peptidyl-prolyl cis-trans isomerase n=1 Tax=Bacillus anthracis TaxID=1392 RepID=UPI001ADF75D9|nr:peptidyl-prolyl cis-trans isomerase [Bacillus anthracis]MBP0704780.1 peptidyl-prolyl cis-trans isomerase [Bacillus anthracis]MBP0733745.1 peptidyl-prolyl cis-trans isomerase [Bacillus anthracis]MBP0773390.1 peptidyl-prolyl cis-trans isomerase [Bacillus anthracis]MBP0920715.1 peptidyl-prolyl cis-trans isomerase [Bacillus anthracis]HDR5461839.1 peptidyl-prolyl cis-trans isomerase [Bacillus anthracis]